MSNKISLNKAFRKLRTLGYFAKQDFWCCQSCALADIEDEYEEKYVYYHAQDADDLKKNGSCCLGWAGNGKEICNVLESFNIKVDWDGSNKTRIKITLKDGKQ